MIPVIIFYTNKNHELTSMYTPPADECRIIKRFIEYGYPVNVDSTKPCPTKDIRGLHGFTWHLGSEELEYTSESDEGAFLLIYFNDKIDSNELEAARSHFAGLLGLSTFSRKTIKQNIPSGLFEPIKPQPCSLNSCSLREGADEGKRITTIIGGERNDEVTRLILSLV